ncbi:MAG: hypothetical protein R2780_05250 [Crocinitomicaceae bacterium]|nr:hypothetical protein [Crocinitomicaceae bacterium]
MRVYYLLLIFLFSCSSAVEKKMEEANDHVEDQDPSFSSLEVPEHEFYVDDELVSGVNLEFGASEDEGAKPVFARINGTKYEVLKYEGTLMSAFGNSEGYQLRMEPFNHFDQATEQEIKSKYDYYLDIQLNREQNKVLGFVTNDDSTHNLEWDYFENLMEVFYYKKNGKNYPLKFIDHGKTEWDG